MTCFGFKWHNGGSFFKQCFSNMSIMKEPPWLKRWCRLTLNGQAKLTLKKKHIKEMKITKQNMFRWNAPWHSFLFIRLVSGCQASIQEVYTPQRKKKFLSHFYKSSRYFRVLCEKSWCSSFKFPLLLGLALYPREKDHKSPHQDVSAMLTVAKYPIKQRRKTTNSLFFVCAQSNENVKMENPGLSMSFETLHSVNFTRIRVISGTLTNLSLWHQPCSILHVGQLDKCSEKL